MDNKTNSSIGIDSIRNSHYILIDETNLIISGWSTGPHPKFDTSAAICISEQGSYQFRLNSTGEENPPILTDDEIPLYRWDGKKVIPRTEEEIQADRDKITQSSTPTDRERLEALEAAML
ncbi:MAG: hypothetical protein NC548_40335, partial [Lachnospiraceae bacterium]|nr:hypothetical protein [Lachnospiraceae bacterium]